MKTQDALGRITLWVACLVVVIWIMFYPFADAVKANPNGYGPEAGFVGFAIMGAIATVFMLWVTAELLEN